MRSFICCGICAILLVVIIAGCSSDGTNPVVPEERSMQDGHMTWGLWQFTADPDAGTLDAVMLRMSNMHLNAMPFLEPPPFVNISLESVQFNGNIVEVDIGLRHPFLGLTEFSGFDVCGILIANGSVTGFTDPGLLMAGDTDTRILNPDGLTRWWNPSEFPVNDGTMFSYTDGLMGAPDSFADYNSTLNGYKYFTDELTENDPISMLNPINRGLFSAGQKNVRHYTIELGTEGLVFNYAVDANWMFPTGQPPYNAPDDFPPDANRPEAYRINVNVIENSLWNDGVGSGGDLRLGVDVYDWHNADQNTAGVESLGNFTSVLSAGPSGGGIGYSTYEIDIIGIQPPQGTMDMLISIASEEADFAGFIPGINTTSYFTDSVSVGTEPPVSACKNIQLRDGVDAIDITIDHTNGDLLVLYEDKMLYKHAKVNGCYEDGEYFIPITDHLSQDMYAIDMAVNRDFVIALTYVTPQTPGGFIYGPTGDFIQYFGQGPPAGRMEAYTLTDGPYQNDVGFVRGRDQYSTGYYQTIVLRITKSGDTYVYGAVYDFVISDGNKFGYDRVYYDYIAGVETDITGDSMWILEDLDYYTTRWELQMVGPVGNLVFDNAYFGTGSQTDNDDGWNDAKDITRDDQNNYFVLDELSTGVARVKMWSVSGDIVTSLGGFGDASSISGAPIRIEGSDFDGDIVVLHGTSQPHMISLFTPSEMPGG